MAQTKVFVNGTFDLLHKGHLELLNFAKSLGDRLYVGIDTDRRVSEKKGPSRPIYNQEERKFFLENLKAVDKVSLFDSDLELEVLINFIQPDIMVVGSDWEGKSVIGSMYAAKLVFFSRISDYATTKTIQRIIDRRDL
jgi:D-beta-D-heptose 7-phosphate kinase/D-beta-D-heptose 1-phosphate adenosyltransferase|tara:strand:- start:3771 stop:4184 length:414 start_codon:yes stop_codon:yes gene_type:complete